MGETIFNTIRNRSARSALTMDDEFSQPIRKVTKLQPLDNYLNGSWEALGAGAPVLVALAQLSSTAMVESSPKVELEELLPQAKAILFAAKNRGSIELKGSNTSFDAPARMLAVYVEVDEDQTIVFRDPKKPEVTVQFLEGFRTLCQHGLVMHHIYRDFSLSCRGFELAKMISQKEVQVWLDKGTEFGLHD